jgi:hypothetical protein
VVYGAWTAEGGDDGRWTDRLIEAALAGGPEGLPVFALSEATEMLGREAVRRGWPEAGRGTGVS